MCYLSEIDRQARLLVRLHQICVDLVSIARQGRTDPEVVRGLATEGVQASEETPGFREIRDLYAACFAWADARGAAQEDALEQAILRLREVL